MGELFRRRARLTVGAVLIESSDSLDFSFSVERTLTPTPNKCEVSIWNLAPTTRTALASLDKIPTRLEAGYENATAQLFFGNLRTAVSRRDGPDIVTTITAGDGEDAYQKARVNQVIPKGTNLADAVSLIALSAGLLPGNVKTALANLSLVGGPTLTKALVLHGSASRAIDMLIRSTQANWSIQDGAVQVLPQAQIVPGTAILLTPETGLLGSPTIDNKGTLQCETLLIPEVAVGRLLVVESEFVKGQFRCEKTVHKGDTAGDEWGISIEASRF